jgi:hypothetical protein
MVIFYSFSRSPGADSGGLEKRDSTADSAPSRAGFLAAAGVRNGPRPRTWQRKAARRAGDDSAGCPTRIGDAAADVAVSDQVHITERDRYF